MTRASILRRLMFLCTAVVACTARGGAPETGPAVAAPVVWEETLKDFTESDYAQAVERVLNEYETTSGRKLHPGEHGKVGLKIYSDSGPGLSTPPALVRALIHALEQRGFAAHKIFLVGLNQLRLRQTGFLPALSTGLSTFSDHPVFVLESGRFYDPQWFYDSPLPSRFNPGVLEAPPKEEGKTSPSDLEKDRRSFLATPLFLDADFWINLPAYSDHPVLGVNGALVNATLWNASNTQRFFRSPGNAPAAVAEMAAVPELREHWVLTIASLERYQFLGGPYFNSLYTYSEHRLWASTDPVILDALMLDRINQHRKATGFEPLPDDRRLLEFAEQLGVGSQDVAAVKWRRF